MMTEQENPGFSPFSIIMLAGHRPISVEKLERSLETDIYTRLLIELLQNGWAEKAELWTYTKENTCFTYNGVQIRGVSDWNKTYRDSPADIVFVRADRRLFTPALKNGIARRTLFYGASTRGIPRHWKKFHGIFVDHEGHIPIVRQFYPGAYIAPFLKPAAPEAFLPEQDCHTLYDICIAGEFKQSMPNTFEDINAVLRECSGLRIAICGKTDEEFENQLPDSNNQINLLGRISQDQLNRVFNQSKMALLTEARIDAAPRILLEYMASGLPVLANEKLRSIDRFVSPEAGEKAKAEDFPEMVRHMLGKLNSYNPRGVFETYFTPEKAAADLAGHIRAVLNMDDAPPRPSIKGRFSRILRPRLRQKG